MDEEKDNIQSPKIKDKIDSFTEKSKKKIKITKLLKKHPWLFILIVSSIVIFILVIGFLYVIDVKLFNEGSKAKKSAVAISVDGKKEVTETTKIIISKTDSDIYSINDTYTNEELDEIKQELEKTGVDTSEFSDFEMGIVGGLVENDLDANDYTTEELKCLPKFLKAEASTQYLDLRSNKDKFKNGEYKPQQLDDLKENEVSGVILVQRSNTKQTTPTTLEYKKLDDFNNLVNNNDINSINYFTINEKGNLVIAKWDQTIVKVSGEYPENLSDEEKVQARNDYIITTTEIPYSNYVAKYTMPFDFLLQLLIITEDPNFCTEVADIVLGSKIVINIQEEETVTVTTEKRTYDIYNKEEKYIDYGVTPNIENATNYFLNLTKDDENNDCTTFSTDEKKVTITTTNTSHTYAFEILESDTWIAHYKKTYGKQQPATDNNSETIESKGEYQQGEEVTITDDNEIIKDKNIKDFKKEKEDYYRKQVTTPRITVHQTGTQAEEVYPNEVVTAPIIYQINVTPAIKIKSTSLFNNRTSATYNNNNLPRYITVVTDPYEISFQFTLINNSSYVCTSNNINQIINCNISKLLIKPFSKINLNNNITTTVTKYPSDPNPTTNTHIYAKDDSGNFEKFLIAYDNSEKAVEMIKDVDSWLFEMMEEEESTINLIDIVKYLLYMYDGTDYGVTELNLEDFFATEMNNTNFVNSIKQFLQFLHSWEGGGTIYKDSNGVDCYKVQPDGGGGSAVGYGVDIATHGNRLRGLGYDTSIGSLIPVDIVDEIEKEEVQMLQDKVKSMTASLNLTEYQIYALISRCYNYGLTGGLKQAKNFKYPSNETFVSAYNKYYTNINNDDYFGDYTKTDFSNKLFTEYMTWLNYAQSGTHPKGWEYRRKSEWCLFQTGYYGYDLKHGTGHGMDEYYMSGGAATDFTNNINLYNGDGSVNTDSINQLNNWLTNDLLNTKIHTRTYEMQGGPFAKWWDSSNNWFTSAGYKFQCTWYVYGRANQFLETYGSSYKSWPGTKNDAGKWYYSRTNGGEKYFECGSTPRQNSIAVWKDGSNAGHVAYVEAVDTINNKVYISHAGGGRSWFGITSHGINEIKSLWEYQLLGYVYLDSPKK